VVLPVGNSKGIHNGYLLLEQLSRALYTVLTKATLDVFGRFVTVAVLFVVVVPVSETVAFDGSVALPCRIRNRSPLISAWVIDGLC
jgi:hypothetical protein